MRRAHLIILLLLTFSLVAPVLADNTTTISISNLNLITKDDVQIIGYNDTSGAWELLGIYNTSSPGLKFQPGIYQMVISPSAVHWFSDPWNLFTGLINFGETNIIPLIGILGAIIVVTGALRRR